MREASIVAARRRRRWWLPPLLLGGLLAATWVAGHTILASYVVFGVYLNTGWVFALAVAVLAAAVWFATWRVAAWVRVLAVYPFAMLASIGVLTTILFDPDPEREEIYFPPPDSVTAGILPPRVNWVENDRIQVNSGRPDALEVIVELDESSGRPDRHYR